MLHVLKLIAAVSSVVLLVAGSSFAEDAQSYPTRPIHMIVPFEPGGPNDVLGRILAQKAAEYLGRSVVVENRVGAGGSIGTDAVARAKPDGYTLLFSGTSSLSINPSVQKAIPYDPIRDFEPVALIGTSPSVLIVPPPLPVNSVPDLIAYAKQNPGTLNFGSGGIGAAPFLAGEMLKTTAGIDLVHVPYKGASPALVALMAQDIQVYFGGITSIIPLIKNGQVRAIGVTSLKRTPLLPDVPTISEALPGFEVTNWYGVVAPAGTPKDIVTRLHDVFAKATEDARVQKALVDLGIDASSATTEELRVYMKKELEKWAGVIKAAGVTPQ
jgi:tripartite-type tricarboxylate transporter receptor subunit TctC